MSKILIVDDELKIREVVKEYAKHHGYEVFEAEDGMQAIDIYKDMSFDCVVLDIMMPKMDGYTTCKEMLRIRKTPIIMLSARHEEYDKLLGFELGVDDYVVKPFSPNELMARIKVVIDRNTEKPQEHYVYEGLDVNVDARTLSIDGEKVLITPKEFDLLVYLMMNKNTAIHRDVLLEHVWNYTYFGDDRTVDTHIKMLRHNLKDYRKFIVTVRGTGYKFEV
jgi:two-component system, OmpR family, response regulator ResD